MTCHFGFMACQKFGTKWPDKGLFSSFWESNHLTRSSQLLRVRQVLEVVIT